MLLLHLTLWLVSCFGARNVTLFFTSTLHLPNATGPNPDDICKQDGSERSWSYPTQLGPSFSYAAVFFMSYRRDLRPLFSDATSIQTLDGRVLTNDPTQFLINGGNDAYFAQSSDGSTYTRTEAFWSGGYSLFQPAPNCADFTDKHSETGSLIGSLGGGIGDNTQPCDVGHRFLCVVSNESFPVTNQSDVPVTNQTSYLFATNTAYPGNVSNPDEICFSEGQNNTKLKALNLKLENYQALVFTLRRRSLRDMFADIFVHEIRDLDDNIIALTSDQLFQYSIYNSSLKRANSKFKFDIADAFWTGAGDDSGTLAGANCADWTNSGLDGSVGKLGLGLFDEVRGCNGLHPFVCAAKVVPLPPLPTREGLVAYLFLSSTHVLGNISNPDEVCKKDKDNLPSFLNTGIFRALLHNPTTNNSFDLQGASIRDLNGIALPNDLSQLFGSQMKFALAGPANVSNDMQTMFWTGSGDMFGTEPGVNCHNFSLADAAYGSSGSFFRGLNDSAVTCNSTNPLLCAVFVNYSRNAPTIVLDSLKPTPLPPSSAPQMPLIPPSLAPTSSSPASVSVPFNGSDTPIVVSSNTSVINISFPSDPALGPNGTVNIIITGRQPDVTVSEVVSIIFIVDGGPRNITNLTNPVIITFPLPGPLHTYVDVNVCVEGAKAMKDSGKPLCGYRNEITNTWETDGCATYTVPSSTTTLQCRCTHFTDFALILPRHNNLVPTEILNLTTTNVANKPTGLIAILIILVVFGVFFGLAKRRDWKESQQFVKLRDEKTQKWASFTAAKQRRSLCKQVKIDFQKRHTWFSLIFRKSGTSFQSVDRTFVALLSVFASMSMSAHFHAQDNDGFARTVIVLATVCACFLPSQFLTQLFVRTGEMGFFEEFEFIRNPPKYKCSWYRFPSWCRHVWRFLTLCAVVGMIIYVLNMSMRFDLQPFFYCQGAPAQAWVSTWLLAYAVSVLLVEPIRILLLAAVAFYSVGFAQYSTDIQKTALQMDSTMAQDD